ncbi:DUF362 domain-containing protein [bacterium]|nr:DUF362 domain-containing protein [bacterium]
MCIAPSVVMITRAKPLDFTRDFVCLAKEYGTAAYDAREDIQTVNAAVNQNLTELDARVHFTEKLRGKKVVIKPNLVTVFHKLGMVGSDYPESTDPRVIDAVVVFIKQYTDKIVIVESSGKGFPTPTAFKATGLDRLAKLRGVELMVLEMQPVDRYLLPKAKVMREIVVPQIFSEVARHEAFYISIPKMKTNLYTGVTLGFKNAMGTIPYNLRLRNHNHAIDQKLVDMLHLFKPDLVVIDGLVGGEGNCPAPVEPVQSRVIVSGNHAVETDRVATRMMGFDPKSIALMRIADENGFNDPKVEVVGEQVTLPYKPADPSLTGAWMRRNFPNVRVLVGHNKGREPQPASDGSLNPNQICDLENVCRGGCLATTRVAFDYMYYEGQPRSNAFTLIIGAGLQHDGKVLYYDGEGKPYTLEDIAKLKCKKLAGGTCTEKLQQIVTRHIDGCMPFPNSPHMLVHQMTNTFCKVMTPKNHYLIPALLDTFAVCEGRKKNLRKGLRIDIPLAHADRLYETRELTLAEKELDYIHEPYPALTKAEIRTLCGDENRSILATFLP